MSKGRIIDYFWPTLPGSLSKDGRLALRADLKGDTSTWHDESSDRHREALSVWTRHADRRAREANCEWARQYASIYIRRWVALGSTTLLIALVFLDSVWISVPLMIVAVVAAVAGLGFALIKRLSQIDPSPK